MSAKTSIEWTDATWNPVVGCSAASAGCANCYAARMAARFAGAGRPFKGLVKDGRWNGKARLVKSKLEQPLHWKKPRRVFVNSMGDLFHSSVPDGWIDRVFAVMARARRHTFQILTKRPARMLAYMMATGRLRAWGDYAPIAAPHGLPNVWLGVSVENQAIADERIPLLLQTPAAMRFVSCEPLLGPADLHDFLWAQGMYAQHPFPAVPSYWIDWVIAGGESGPGARPMPTEWVRSLRDQCDAAGVPFFFKGWGEWSPNLYGDGRAARNVPCGDGTHHRMYRVGKRAAGRLLDGREHSEFPGARA